MIGFLTLCLFASQVNSVFITQIPCVDQYNSYPITGSVSDTLLFNGCQNSTAAFNLTSKIWSTIPSPSQTNLPYYLYSEEAQAIFYVGSNSSFGGTISYFVFTYNVTTNIWSNDSLNAVSKVYTATYYQGNLVVAGVNGGLDIFAGTYLASAYIRAPYFYSNSFSVLVDNTVYFITRNSSSGYNIQGFRIPIRQVLPVRSLKFPDVIVDIGFKVSYKILVFASSTTYNTTVNIYDTTNDNLTSLLLPVRINAVRDTAAVAGNYALIQILNRNTPSIHFLYLYNSVDNNFQEIPGSGTPYAGGDYILVLSNTSVRVFSSSTGQFSNISFSNPEKAVYAVYSENIFYIVKTYSNSNHTVYAVDPETSLIIKEVSITHYQFSQGFGLKSGVVLLFSTPYYTIDSFTLIPCDSHADCINYCGGVEYCDNTGFCSPGTANPCQTCQYCNSTTSSCEDEAVGTVCNIVNNCTVMTCNSGSCSDLVNNCPTTSTTSTSTSTSTSSTTATTSSSSTTSSSTSTSSDSTSTSSTSTTGAAQTIDTTTSTTTTTIISNNSTSTTLDPNEQQKLVSSSKSSSSTPIIASVVSVLGVILLLIIAFFVFRRFKNKRNNYSSPPTRPKSVEIEMPSAGMIKDVVIERTLASGNFGDVYQGKMDGNVLVALKTLKASDYTTEFQREANILR